MTFFRTSFGARWAEFGLGAAALTVTVAVSYAIFRIVAGIGGSAATLDPSARAVLVSGAFPSVLRDYVGAGGPFDLMAVLDVGGVRYRTATSSGWALCLEVSPSLFSIVTTRPVLGRMFVAQDEESVDGVAIVSERFWNSRLRAADGTIGQTMMVQSVPHRIVGVVSRDLDALAGADVVIAKRRIIPGTLVDNSAAESVNVDGALLRLQQGVGPEAALRTLKVGGAADKRLGVQLNVIPLGDALQTQFRGLKGVLSAGAVLVIICGWSTITLLHVGFLRSNLKQIAVQVALGATLRALLVPYLRQWLVLAAVSSASAIFLYSAILSSLRAAFPRFGHFLTVDDTTWRSGLPAIEMAIVGSLAGFLFCSFLVARVRRVHLPLILNDGDASFPVFGRLSGQRLSMAMQIGCGVALFGISVMLCRASLAELSRERGFEPNNLVAFDLAQPMAPFSQGVSSTEAPADRQRRFDAYQYRMTSFYQDSIDNLRGMPQVDAVAFTSRLPMSRLGSSGQFTDAGNVRHGLLVDVIEVTGDFFAAAGAVVVKGVALTSSASAAEEWTIVVSESVAQKYWADQNPIGQLLKINRGRPRRVVGVVRRIDVLGLGADFPGQTFVPSSQPVYFVRPDLTAIIRLRTDARVSLTDIQARIDTVRPGTEVYGVRTGRDLLDEALGPLFARTLLSIALALAMMLLSCLGVSAAVRQWIIDRRREMQIRVVLGATPVRLAVRTVGLTLAVLAAGVIVGLSLTLGAARVLESKLIGVTISFIDVLPGVGLAILIVLVVSLYGAARAVSNLLVQRN